jgi:hypothetical protein
LRIELDKRFKKQIKGSLEKHAFQIGVTQSGIHKRARSKRDGLKSFAGGPARRTSSRPSGVTNADLAEFARKKDDIFRAPFDNPSKSQKDILAFTNEFFKYTFGKSTYKRLENLLQAIVRNPILRGDYGRNARRTAIAKGFNRLYIDTAQMFRSIKARVTRV